MKRKRSCAQRDPRLARNHGRATKLCSADFLQRDLAFGFNLGRTALWACRRGLPMLNRKKTPATQEQSYFTEFTAQELFPNDEDKQFHPAQEDNFSHNRAARGNAVYRWRRCRHSTLRRGLWRPRTPNVRGLLKRTTTRRLLSSVSTPVSERHTSNDD